jgi:hypothetical protein
MIIQAAVNAEDMVQVEADTVEEEAAVVVVGAAVEAVHGMVAVDRGDKAVNGTVHKVLVILYINKIYRKSFGLFKSIMFYS